MENKVAVIGLGYVGLPLLCHISTKYPCTGLDISEVRVSELSSGFDKKNCVNSESLQSLKTIKLTTEWKQLNGCNIFIVTAPTPIDEQKHPDISSLKDICKRLGGVISPGSVIVFESTVAPGTTEDICVPIIEKSSSMSLNVDFAVGFSPERINIGDNQHTLSSVPKIISASTQEALSIIAELYTNALGCGVVVASSIKTAEAAKLYENVQRDVLIALANQYSEYCQAEGIDISEVTRCAATKWNFAEVYPGLVGGHCIGVDPYYLLHRAKTQKVNMDLVKQARIINEGKVVELASKIIHYGITPHYSKRVLLLGFSYKPDISDIRNTKVADLYNLLKRDCKEVDCYDPIVNTNEVNAVYGIKLICDITTVDFYSYDMIITVVPHKGITELIPANIKCLSINQFI